MSSTIKKMIPAVVLCAGAMVIFSALGYIDADVILRVYLPLFAAIFVTLLMKQYFAAYGVVLGVILGLTVEYAYHLPKAHHPNMVGALLNTLILIACGVIGVLLQVAANRWKRKKEQQEETA